MTTFSKARIGSRRAGACRARRSVLAASLVGIAVLTALTSATAHAGWSAAGQHARARYAHTATLLPNGTVLAAAGHDRQSPTSTAEIYTPGSGWTATGFMAVPRRYHTATLLGDGTVLAAGGLTFSRVVIGGGPCPGTDFAVLDSAEVYNPLVGQWTSTGKLLTARDSHTASLLGNGKVLVAGGVTNFPLGGVDSAELYDPLARAWTPAASMTAGPRVDHTATVLRDGRVLVAGGATDAPTGTLVKTAEIYDPATDTWTRTSNDLATARKRHAAALLPDGRVLVVGGEGGANTAEVFDPASRTWSPAADMAAARTDLTATAVGGRVLVTGGSAATTADELYEPGALGAPGSWSTSGSLLSPRFEHTATLLPSGRVLVAGGFGPGSSCAWDTSEVRAAADLEAGLTATPNPVEPGGTLTLTMTVKNAGPDPAESTTARLTLPAGAETVSLPAGCTEEPAVAVVCDLGTIAKDAAPQRQIPLRVTGPDGSTLTSVVAAQSAIADVDEADNRAGVAVPVVARSAPVTPPPPPPASTGGSPLTGGSGGVLPPPPSGTGGGAGTGTAAARGRERRRARSFRRCRARAARRGRVGRRASTRARRRAAARRRAYRRRCVRRYGRVPGRVRGLRARALSRKRIRLSFRVPGTHGMRPPPARTYLVKQSQRRFRSARGFRRARSLCRGKCRISVTRVRSRVTLTILDLRPRTTYYYAVAARDNVTGRLGRRSRTVRARTR